MKISFKWNPLFIGLVVAAFLSTPLMAIEKEIVKTGNIKGWLDLNQIYLQALQSSESDIEPESFEFSEKDFEKLQFDEEFRTEYLELMFFIEETCVTSTTRTPACQRLISSIEKTSLEECLGLNEDASPSQQVEQLGSDLMPILAAGNKNNPHSAYSTSNGVKNMIARLRQNLRKNCTASRCSGSRRPGTTGKCYRYVKWGLMAGGYSKNYIGGVHARDAGPHLRGIGFKNIMGPNVNSRNAPVGAILVYTGGKSGHIEVKAGANEYLSDFSSSGPIDSRTSARRLIGVYVK